jgi:O-antigen ligase
MMHATDKSLSPGLVFPATAGSAVNWPKAGDRPASFKVAFAGLFLFTLLLYARPQEMFPEFFGSFPLVKLVAIGTLLAYFFAKLSAGERLTHWSLELSMVLVIAALGIAFTPIAAAPQDSIKVLTDVFLKVVIIFLLMINLLDTPDRLRSIIKLSVICGTALAGFAFFSYVTGNFMVQDKKVTNRVAGIVAGMFGNPNDLALSLDLLLPLAVALALNSRGNKRIVYSACVVLLAVGVVVTFSRGGFLGLVALALVLLWKFSRRRRGLTIFAFLLATGFFLFAMPAGYSGRLTTILSVEEDPTGSAQARRELLDRGIQVAANHLLIGVGMGNFHIYSIREQVAHNSYLEISSELGIAGLIAYLILIFAPLRSLRRIERETRMATRGALIKGGSDPPEQQTYYFSVALQASIVAYMVCSFFGSVEYLWHLYYLVAYSLSLKAIYAREQSAMELQSDDEGVGKEVAIGKALKCRTGAGVLWKPHQRAE